MFPNGKVGCGPGMHYLETRTNGHGNADMEDADMEDADIKKITLETLKYLIT
jgi:hypothetical protein